jgi:hypothetical protein
MEFHRMLTSLEDLTATTQPWRDFDQTLEALRIGLAHRSIQNAISPQFLILERLALEPPFLLPYRNPAINLDCQINTSGHFEIFWKPRVYTETEHGIPIDRGIDYHEKRLDMSRDWGRRPDTEILRIRDFAAIAGYAQGASCDIDDTKTFCARVIIVMVAKLYEEARRILSFSTEVKTLRFPDFSFDPAAELLTGPMMSIGPAHPEMESEPA